MIFDAASVDGHNNIELAHWRAEFSDHLRSKEYLEQFLSHYPPAESV